MKNVYLRFSVFPSSLLFQDYERFVSRSQDLELQLTSKEKELEQLFQKQRRVSWRSSISSRTSSVHRDPWPLSPAGAAVPDAARRTARDQGAEHQAEADQRRAGARAGAEQPGAAAGPGAAQCAAGGVGAAARGEGDVSVRRSRQQAKVLCKELKSRFQIPALCLNH